MEAWLQRSDCDVLAIQETKCKDDNFPWELFERMGYEVAHFGLNQWNGVAIASRVGLDDVERAFVDQPVFGKAGKDPDTGSPRHGSDLRRRPRLEPVRPQRPRPRR